MSQFVDDIIHHLDKNSDLFTHVGPGALRSVGGDTDISGHGNTALLSIIKVRVQDEPVPLTYMDTYKLEKAVSRWFRNISLNHLIK